MNKRKQFDYPAYCRDKVKLVRYQNIFLENEIRKAIRTKFPLLSLNIYHDVSRDEYVVAIDNRSVYYSEEYQKLVMDLKINSLWPASVDNYFFVVEQKPPCHNATIFVK